MSSPKKAWANYDPITPTLLNDIGNFADDYFEITTGEAINGTTTPIPVCIKPTVGTVFKADGNDATLFNFIGFIVGNYGSAATALVKKAGIVGGFTGLTAGSYYYVQDAVGTIGSTPGTYECLVGIAVSTTQIFIMRNQLQYLGSAAITNDDTTTTAVPIGTRMIVLQSFASHGGNATTGNSDGGGQVVLMRNGLTTGYGLVAYHATSGGSSVNDNWFFLKGTWNVAGATITGMCGEINYAGTKSFGGPAPTAYFYG